MMQKELLLLCHLLLFLGSLVVLVMSNKAQSSPQEHWIFPAARMETYSADSGILRVVNPLEFQIIHNAVSDQVNDFLNAAETRFLKSNLFCLPDFVHDFVENPDNLTLESLTRLSIHVTNNITTDLRHGTDESYSLYILSGGDNSTTTTADAELNATTVYGVLRGLETFSQLLEFAWLEQQGSNNAVFVIRNVPLFIQDAPEYPYRGLMIDTARHYLPMSLILTNLNAMAMNKLNVLHWHMTDSQSFPYQSIRYPELAAKGAFHPRRIYTPQDVQLVVREAKLRGIRVIVELDVPGHTMAIQKSHPEIMSHCPEASEPLDPTNPQVYEILTELYSEMQHLIPDEFVHVGGDEVSFECWKQSPSIQEWMIQHGIKNETALYEYFETKLLAIVGDTMNKTAIVWQEVFDLGLLSSLRNDTIIDIWKQGDDDETIQQATLASFRVIVSKCWYLDHLNEDWSTFYQCIPRNFTGTNAQKDLVLGGHASMWGEHVDASNFMSRVWPRASAAAERLWSISGTSSSDDDSVQDRIGRFRCHMVAKGIAAGPIGPGSCDREPSFLHEKPTTPRGWPLLNTTIVE